MVKCTRRARPDASQARSATSCSSCPATVRRGSFPAAEVEGRSELTLNKEKRVGTYPPHR
jgi:hypothetical protein